MLYDSYNTNHFISSHGRRILLVKMIFRNTDGHQSSPEVPDFKKSRLGAGLPTFAPPTGQPMESTLANLAVFMQNGNQVNHYAVLSVVHAPNVSNEVTC